MGYQQILFCNKMTNRIALFVLLAVIIGCGDADRAQVPNLPSLLDLVESRGEVLFVDSSPGGVTMLGEDVVYCILRFKKNHEVSFESSAYNFCNFHGKFRIEENTVTIELDSHSDVFLNKGEARPIIFPSLELMNSSEGLRLIRKDGERHLKEHWNVYKGVDIFPLVVGPTPIE
jgi:hypothetical protein